VVARLGVGSAVRGACHAGGVEFQLVTTAHDAADAAAAFLARHVRNAVRRRGAATLAVSGGSTPALMFAALIKLDLPWQQVGIWQVDERVAAATDPARNAHLLAGFTEVGAAVHLMPVEARQLVDAADRYTDSLPERFDVVHLGLGDDGHTASWPPDDPVIDSDEAVAMSRHYNGFVRMTLTPRVVNAARHRLVLATGSAKAAPVSQWLLGDTSLPIQRVRRTDTVVVLDQAAAALLPAAG